MKTKSFTLSVSLPSSAETVFGALTNARLISEWSGQRGKVQPTIGGTMELFDGWVKGIVLAYEVGKRLSFTWKPAEWAEEDQSSIVTCHIIPKKNGSILTVKHSGFPNDSELQSHKDGWTEFVFEPLKMYLISKQE